MGEGFVPHEPELVKIHCLWPEEPAVLLPDSYWVNFISIDQNESLIV